MNNLNHVDLLLTAEECIVGRGQLRVDPRMQMRIEMHQPTIEKYANGIKVILEKHPIEVVEVENAEGVDWFIVDGFHRYHAVLLADIKEIPIKLMKGTFQEAQRYAMTTNGEHGLAANDDDYKRAIGILLESAPDFGYDKALVIPWLEDMGYDDSTSARHSVAYRGEIVAKREAEILRLDAAGNSQRSIATEVGCGVGTVNRCLEKARVPKDSLSEMEQDENQATTPSTYTSPFSDEECDTTPAHNPAAIPQTEAFQKALSEHVLERQESQGKSAPIIPKVDVENEVATPLEEMSGAINTFVEMFRRHGHATLLEFVKDEGEINNANLNKLMEIGAALKNHMS